MTHVGNIQSEYRLARFTVKELRNRDTPANRHNIETVGLLFNGFPIQGLQLTPDSDGEQNSILLVAENPVVFNGWFFVTSLLDTALDPVRFILEGSNDGSAWEVVGSSSWEKGGGHYDGYYYTTKERGHLEKFEFSTTWQWVCRHIIANIVSCGLCLAFFTIGFLEVGQDYVYPLTVAYLLASALTTGFGTLHVKQYSIMVRGWGNALAALGFALIMLCGERWFWLGLLYFGLGTFVLGAVVNQAYYGDPPLIIYWYWAMGTLTTGFVVLAAILRVRARRRSAKLLEPFNALYQSAWADLQHEGQLQRLRTLVASSRVGGTERGGRERVVRQFTRLEDAAEQRLFLRESRGEKWREGWRRLLGGDKRQAEDPQRGPAATSLNQLYVQARLLDGVLRSKVMEWARPSGGCFHVRVPDDASCQETQSFQSLRQRPSFVGADEEGQFPLLDIEWAKIKRPQRAVEKLLRVYDMDASRLVDITRQSIYFDSLHSLSHCLEIILSDPQVVVERIKNRMDEAYDASVSGGYRDCSLNLRIVTPESRRCRTDLHVCEVQLVLKKIAMLKTSDGHKGYVLFRNTRGQ